MKCPQCGKELDIPASATINMESYGRSVIVRTGCCGKLVKAYPIMTYHVDAYEGPNTEDDWGRVPRK